MESKDTAKCKVCQKMFKIDNAVISHSQGKIPNLKLILYLRIQRWLFSQKQLLVIHKKLHVSMLFSKSLLYKPML